MIKHLPIREIESLWTLVTAPTLWAGHFLLCYVGAAVYCAKAGPDWPDFDAVRTALIGATLLVLAGIAVSAVLALRQWEFGRHDPPHDEDSPEDRRRFQGFATLLLSGLSFIAVIYTALPLIVLGACRP